MISDLQGRRAGWARYNALWPIDPWSIQTAFRGTSVMTTSSNEFQLLMSKAMDGQSDAVATLIERYEPQIRIVVRARLGASLKPYLDSMDIVQSVHRDMITGLQRGQFEIESQEKLIALAATIVRRKIARHWRHLKKEAVFPEYELADSHPAAEPIDVLSAQELSDEILDRLNDEDRKVLELRLLGHSTAEAARQLGLNPNVVRIRLSRLRKKLGALAGLDSQSDRSVGQPDRSVGQPDGSV